MIGTNVAKLNKNPPPIHDTNCESFGKMMTTKVQAPKMSVRSMNRSQQNSMKGKSHDIDC